MTERPTALQVVEGIDLSGKACVVTGASCGLGRESARALAAAGAHVVLAARNQDALAQTAQWIAAEVPGARTSSVQLDLTALASVRAAASAIHHIAPVIDVLMNNAGVMFTPFGRTRDGFEIQIGTNHFGHFELTRLLVPQLATAGNARIVTLSSGGHVMGDVDFDDPNWEGREYDKFVAYGASKTANILHTVEADRRLRDLGIRAYAVHPGTVATSLARYMSRTDFSQLRKYGRRQHRRARRTDRRLPRLHHARTWCGHPSVGRRQPGTGGQGSVVSGRLRSQRSGRALCARRTARGGLVDLSEKLCDRS